MKLSDYVIQFFESRGIESVFFLPGGGIMHLVDSLRKSKKIRPINFHHEQAATIAAEGYGRIKNDPGVTLVTTGPGGANAITGIAGAWLDSIPLIVIAGQVKTDNITPRKRGKPTLRALGFQELNVIDLVKPITKYATTVKRAENIKYELEKSFFISRTGRPGPVFLEIPLDIQSKNINPLTLSTFKIKEKAFDQEKVPVKKIVEKINSAKKPLILVGNGVRFAKAEQNLIKFLNKTKINAVTALFTADDLITNSYPNYLGRQGMWGNKSANFAIDNCDLLLIIGERMQLTQTSYEYKKFAPKAFKIMVDIDKEELRKKTLKIDLPVHSDANDFLKLIIRQKVKINKWKIKNSKIDADDYQPRENYVNIYKAIIELGRLSKDFPIVTSNATSALVSHQVIPINLGQRFLTNAGLGHMGSGLPMAIGACIASRKKTICLEGDGSLMLNIQELATIHHNKLPIKIFVINNSGYTSIRNTHKRYFGKIFGSDSTCGVSFPDFSKIIPAWGFKYIRIENDKQIKKIKQTIYKDCPIFYDLIVDPNQPMQKTWTAGDFKE